MTKYKLSWGFWGTSESAETFEIEFSAENYAREWILRRAKYNPLAWINVKPISKTKGKHNGN